MSSRRTSAANGAPEAIANLCHMHEAGLEALRRDVAAVATAALAAAVAVPQLRHLFGFSPLSARDLAVAIFAAGACLAVNTAAIGSWQRLHRG